MLEVEAGQVQRDLIVALPIPPTEEMVATVQLQPLQDLLLLMQEVAAEEVITELPQPEQEVLAEGEMEVHLGLGLREQLIEAAVAEVERTPLAGLLAAQADLVLSLFLLRKLQHLQQVLLPLLPVGLIQSTRLRPAGQSHSKEAI